MGALLDVILPNVPERSSAFCAGRFRRRCSGHAAQDLPLDCQRLATVGAGPHLVDRCRPVRQAADILLLELASADLTQIALEPRAPATGPSGQVPTCV